VRDLARTDQLSRLLTRRALFDEGVELVRRADSGGDGPARLGCIILDIDHFKQVNDRYGHQVGDDVIRLVADVCREALRGGDVVGRYGGEEFCALLPGLTVTETQGVAERICRTVGALDIPAVPDGVTVSLGVAVFEGSGDAADPLALLDNLMGRADVALYRAKNSGRDRVETAP